LAQHPNLPQELRSAQVLARFGVRMIILLAVAAFGSIGFGRSLAALLWMSAILGAVLGTVRREPPFDKVLNHWDETVAYAALCCLVSGFNQAAPF
jgi:VIT1/CCC1 family predicted Fe2+/Mn2+ transporter